MFCSTCGQEVRDEAEICVHCGCRLKNNPTVSTTVGGDMDKPKTGMGVLLGLFLGVIGLIIGILIYPAGTVARKTFIKAWLITFAVSLVIGIVIGVFAGIAAASVYDPYIY